MIQVKQNGLNRFVNLNILIYDEISKTRRFNVERYECDDYIGFRDREEFDKFIDDLFEIFNKSNAKTFGVVIREDLIGNHTDFDNSYLLTNSIPSHLCKSKHKFNEYLYAWKKKEV